MIKPNLNNLNGWQRGYIFFIMFFVLPIAIISIVEVREQYELKYTDQQLNEQINEYIEKEKIPASLIIERDYSTNDQIFQQSSDPMDQLLGAMTVDKTVSATDGKTIKTEFTSKNKIDYLVSFNYAKDIEGFNEDKEILRLASFIQSKIDDNVMENIAHEKYLKISTAFIFVALGIYFFGFMIGWVVKGFKRK